MANHGMDDAILVPSNRLGMAYIKKSLKVNMLLNLKKNCVFGEEFTFNLHWFVNDIFLIT